MKTIPNFVKFELIIFLLFYIPPYIDTPTMSLTKLYQKFEALCEENKLRNFCLEEIKLIIDDEIKEIMENKKTMTNNGQFTFGKYKGKKVEDIAKIDKLYLQWVMTQPWFDKFTDLKAEVKKYL